ncbi:MAG: hypothetical protein ACYCTI_13170 [Acidimicrobiales bacterium]
MAGIGHELRHDPRARPSGVALFGTVGEAVWPDNARALTESDVLSAGVRVLPVPPSAAVTIFD